MELMKKLFIGIFSIIITLSCEKIENDTIFETSKDEYNIGMNRDTITIINEKRNFKFYMPEYLIGNVSLLFRFHGSVPVPNNTSLVDPVGSIQNNYILNLITDTANVVVVYPVGSIGTGGSSYGWTETEKELDFFDRIIEYFESQYSGMNFTNIYVCGHSSGAIFSFALAGYRANIISASVPVSGQYKLISGINDSFTSDNISTPIRAYNGTVDNRVDYQGAYKNIKNWVELKNKGNSDNIEESSFNLDAYNITSTKWLGGLSDIEMYTLDGVGHGISWNIIAESMWDFMKLHKKE